MTVTAVGVIAICLTLCLCCTLANWNADREFVIPDRYRAPTATTGATPLP